MNKKLAGSALLKYPDIIEDILRTVVDAVDVPVTLKPVQVGIQTIKTVSKLQN
ncbi:tRNA dihydrouridine synthase B [Vibrio variabilis]|uniref:tRNA dihydrouridine synthase B n=1 Tax=Vibrio variabilis TaxID=990271 RepID=A0ABQ0JCD0_9VIBR|nr:tRNA dihydrouridine synthase B [Vibrio variabilis]